MLTLVKIAVNVALITGITGQDGAYLAEFRLGKGYFLRSFCFLTMRRKQ